MDKLVGREQRILAWIDGTKILHRFAIWCAARALRGARVVEPCAWGALRAKGRWLRGAASDEELRDAMCDLHHAARDAREAAWEATAHRRRVATEYDPWGEMRREAIDAAREAAMEAALAATVTDPHDAARAAACGAERAVPWETTRDAERAAQAAYLDARMARAKEVRS
jgi:hypothetical protein